VVLSGCVTATLTGQGASVVVPVSCTAAGTCTLTANVTDANGCASQPCTATLTCNDCQPHVQVVKEVACFLGAAGCGTFGPSATGIQDSACPAFCYRVTIKNTDPTVTIKTLVVNDPDLNPPGGDISASFPLPAEGLAPEKSVSADFSPIEMCADHENTVTVTAYSASTATGPSDTQTAKANVYVKKIDVACSISLYSASDSDGIDNQVTLPINSVDVPVQVTLTIKNIGTAAFDVTGVEGLPPLVDCKDTTKPVDLSTVLPTTPVQPGDTIVVLGCWVVSCPGGDLSLKVTVEANDDNGECTYDKAGNKITDVSDSCTAKVICLQGTGCTPGFWKNCTGQWACYTPATGQDATLVKTVFAAAGVQPYTALGNATLHQALSFQGGSGITGAAQILLRAATAAVLNACKTEAGQLSYPLTRQQIIDQVNAALATGNRATILALAATLDGYNNLGCRSQDGTELKCLK